MALRDQTALDADAVLSALEWGEVVTITPDGDTPVPYSVGALITERQDPANASGRSVVSAHGTMAVSRTDFPDDWPRGTVTRDDGSAWTIIRELAAGLMLRRLEIKRNPRASFGGGPGVRR